MISMSDPATVAVLIFDGMSPFESSIAIEVFGYPRPELGVAGYALRICSEQREPVTMLGGATMTAPYGLSEFGTAQTVIVPGVADVHAEVSAPVVEALQLAYRNGARVVSICSGAFALAAAGLLDGRRAATHWRYAAILQRRFPAVLVDPDVLYADEGQVLTGAGSAAGLDLCLHLVRQDYGADIANKVARRLVVSPHRDGGQAQYIEAAVRRRADDDRIQRSAAWALAHLPEPITLARLAGQAHMSARSYARHFVQEYGTSPIRWLTQQRISAALPLLERSDMPVDQVARGCGFDNAATFRIHFLRAMHTSPTGYRRAFRQATPRTPGHATTEGQPDRANHAG